MVSIETVSPELTVSLGFSRRIEPAPLHRLERGGERVMLAGGRFWRPIVVAASGSLLLRIARAGDCGGHENG